MFTLTRSEHNPILSPEKDHPWEAAASFNGCPVNHGWHTTTLLYRAMSAPDPIQEPHIATSCIGRATSGDGVHFKDREQFIIPDRDYDRYGCEDPRVTKLDGTYYTFYTALGDYPFGKENIKVAVAISDDLKTVKEKHLVTPFNAKAMTLFPEKINGRMAALLSVNTDMPPSEMCYVEFERPSDMWSPEFWTQWYANLPAHTLDIRRKPEEQVEVGAPPVKTKHGWLVVYSHVQNYFTDHPVFGIEAVLLDLKNPRKVVGRTKGPIMVPSNYYEQSGMVPNVTFPTGAIVRGKRLDIYYGAADTHCAIASLILANLLESMLADSDKRFLRFPRNPIISPRQGLEWEKLGTLNPAAVDLGGKVHILYRAVSGSNVSTIGYAVSTDGLTVDERLPEPIYKPRAEFERRGGETSNFGCEDPRIVHIGDRLHIIYTAYNGSLPRVAVASISVKDFLARKWDAWSDPHVITPGNVDDKDGAILPEKIRGDYLIIHRASNTICGDFVPSLDFSKESVTLCISMLMPRRGMWDGIKVGVAAPPFKTKHGWLMLYHGVSWSSVYRVGAVLLDPNNPSLVRARTVAPIFEPETEYEKNGAVSNVVFPCGAVVRRGVVYMYYGAADKTIGVATLRLSKLLAYLELPRSL